MNPTLWKRRASRLATLGNAPPPTARQPCRKYSMRGMTVCRAQGGGSPQAKAKAAAAVELAELRLRGLAPRAVAELENLVTNASSEAVRLGAANSLVDRAVGKATERIQVAAAITVKRPW